MYLPKYKSNHQSLAQYKPVNHKKNSNITLSDFDEPSVSHNFIICLKLKSNYKT